MTSPARSAAASRPPAAVASPIVDGALAALRVAAALLLAQHGLQKLFGLYGGVDGVSGATAPLASLRGLAGVLELLAFLLAIGLFTRPLAFLLAGEMAAAYFMVHFPKGFFPIRNKGELPVVLCFVFLYLAAAGGGRYSVDGMARRSREWRRGVRDSMADAERRAAAEDAAAEDAATR